jgi:hypothetical protein
MIRLRELSLERGKKMCFTDGSRNGLLHSTAGTGVGYTKRLRSSAGAKSDIFS